MKRILLALVPFIFIAFSTEAFNVKRDSVVMGPEYQNDVYYSFNSSITRTVVNNLNYHLAFSNMVSQDDRFYTLWLNPERAKAFVNPSQKTISWNQFDATGSENWDELRNADTSWGKGAFSQGKEAHPRYTWAEYKANGDMRGDSLYLLKIYNPVTTDFDIEFKLMLTQRLSNNGTRTWTFKLGKTNNSWDTTITLTDLVNSEGNFMYYDVINRKEVVREPKTSDWDYVFTRYMTFTQNLHYNVTGLLSNYNIASTSIAGDINDPNIDNYLSQWQYNTLINNIGFEWKLFNMNNFKYELEQNKVRIIKKDLGNGLADFYAMQFVRFEGRTTGKIVFDYAYLGKFSSAQQLESETLKFYPNPTSGNLNLQTSSDIQHLVVYNMHGQNIYEKFNPGSSLDLSFLTNGNYIIQVELKNGQMVRSKMIKI